MIKKALVAVDGSDHANKAVALGADIAAKNDAELVLLHVLLRHELPGDLQRIAAARRAPATAAAGLPTAGFGSYLNLAVDNPAMTEDILRVLGKGVLDNAESLALDHGVRKIAKRIEDGKPVEIILEIAESEGVDLIVTGARGLSYAKALVVGSVSHKVAQLSRVTCVTVHCPP